MSGSSAFPGRVGFNSNPFGSSSSDIQTTQSAGGFGSLQEEDENETITSPTTPNFGNAASLFGNYGGLGGAQVDGPPSSFRPAGQVGGSGLPSDYNMGRRTSVSAESLTPTANSSSNWTPPVHEKSEEEMNLIMTALVDNPLFAHLDKAHRTTIALAMDSKDVPSDNIKVCRVARITTFILTLFSSYRKVTMEITFTWSRTAHSTYMFTHLVSFRVVRTVWARRLPMLERANRLEI